MINYEDTQYEFQEGSSIPHRLILHRIISEWHTTLPMNTDDARKMITGYYIGIIDNIFDCFRDQDWAWLVFEYHWYQDIFMIMFGFKKRDDALLFRMRV